MKKLKRPSINEALRLLRLYRGLNQKELAKAVGVSQSIISEVESGAKDASLDLIEQYSKAFGLKMSQLVFFSEQVEESPPASRGKLIIANSVLRLLDALAPEEVLDAQESAE